MRLDIVGIERRPRERANAIRRPIGRRGDRLADRCIVEVGPEHGHCSGEQLARQRRLTPTHHLGVEPCRLRRIGAWRAGTANEQIVRVTADRAEYARR